MRGGGPGAVGRRHAITSFTRIASVTCASLGGTNRAMITEIRISTETFPPDRVLCFHQEKSFHDHLRVIHATAPGGRLAAVGGGEAVAPGGVAEAPAE